MSDIRTGQVKWFNETKGFGFIAPANGNKDVFVHVSALERAGIRQLNDGQAVTCDDFVNAMQDANGRDLSLFRRWYQQSGTPELKVYSQFDAKKREFKLLMQQRTPATADQAEKQPLLLPVRLELLAEGVSQSYLLEMTEAQQEFSFAVSQKPVPVLLADFSAPVKLQYQYSMDELLQIARDAKDGVARWDAIQQLWQTQVKTAIEAKNAGDRHPAGARCKTELKEACFSWPPIDENRSIWRSWCRHLPTR